MSTLCPGCFNDKGKALVCQGCGFDESKGHIPHTLPFSTTLDNKYLTGKVLGIGGFGITYLGWDITMEAKIAIKEYVPKIAVRDRNGTTIIPRISKDADMFQYGLDVFIKEAQTLNKFTHPNVVGVRTCFKENGTAYFVMNYYEGMSLDDYVKINGGKLSEKEAVRIMLYILNGLWEVHSKGFLHRDIKPENIYITSNGTPILIDFGAARFAMGQLSQSLTVVLSPGFAPFEQYSRTGNQGTWTDIYGCGATLYTMVTGIDPPEATERRESDTLVPPNRLIRTLSDRFSHTVVKALAVRPEHRFQSVRDMINSLLDEVEYTQVTCPHCGVNNRVVKGTNPDDVSCTGCGNTPRKKTVPEPVVEVKKRITPVIPTPPSPVIWKYFVVVLLLIAVSYIAYIYGKSDTPYIYGDKSKKAAQTQAAQTHKDTEKKQETPKQVNKPEPGDIYTETHTQMSFVWLEGSESGFEIGCGDWTSNCHDDESPTRKGVKLDGFWMGQHEVTVKQWNMFVKEKNYQVSFTNYQVSFTNWGCKDTAVPDFFSQDDDHPVVCVTWNDAKAFADWLTEKAKKKEGNNYRFTLPSEAQWEYACRSGGKEEKFAGFSDESQLHIYANFCDKNCGFAWATEGKEQDDGYKYTSPVGHFKKNGTNLKDMTGNVGEWVADIYNSGAYQDPIYANKNPIYESGGVDRVIRGGSWAYRAPADVRCASRYGPAPAYRSRSIGFRLLRTL
ncbi:MAG TPA: bifunctional serine/threonine-protein kinase/formylglycine-generating enzyme family protein [Thermodesulfovibrionia bacterium]|nr:bifunctional serine/threonine-protein kinase/formylglycine-generating enzyme family protein [Thermodesulfovibrionia bacterium]